MIPPPANGPHPGNDPGPFPLDDLLAGARIPRPSRPDYAGCLARHLDLGSRSRAFAGLDPDDGQVVALLPNHDAEATDHLFANAAPIDPRLPGYRSRHHVLRLPETFGSTNWVATRSYPAEYPPPVPAGARALSSWLEEVPLRLPPGLRAGSLPPRASIAAVLRLVRSFAAGTTERAWASACPGPARPYRPRVSGRWHLTPLSAFVVEMGFREDLGVMDISAGGTEAGLLRLYPPTSATGRPLRVNPSTGAVAPAREALLASLRLERNHLHDAVRTVHGQAGRDPFSGVARLLEDAMEDLERLRSGERPYYG